MPALNPTLRNKLETDIIRARTTAERAARAALERLAVHEPNFRASMDDEQKALRRTLRVKARQLGDNTPEGAQADLSNLVRECAYEQWHQMLFAKFLLENDLLMHPEGVAVSFEECAALAEEEGDADAWATAARYASHMLPGIFRPADPLLQVRFALEDRRALEAILDAIPKPTFTSDDGLGWVYQFWQTQAKKEVNQSGRKIGGSDLPAVTQLFTEHYMVQFLLHNTLGAWWASRHPDIPLPTDKSYLRTLDDGTPAAGRFEGWPDAAKELTLMDPCCGSGHFLVAALALLTRMRMLEEGLSEGEAGDAVLRDNLHGLELDPRCTQLATFNLALEAWKRGGYRTLPTPKVACSGISVGGSEEEWTKLAGGDTRAASSLKRLYTLFKNAPDLGSLIDPARLGEDDPLYSACFEEVETMLDRALEQNRSEDDPAAAVFGEAARGVTNAARLLRDKYHIVFTNVPYLTFEKFGLTLRGFVETTYPLSKGDLATAFIERCRNLTATNGIYSLITSHNWLFLSGYKHLRRRLLQTQELCSLATLGYGAFETPLRVVPIISTFRNSLPKADHKTSGFNVDSYKTTLQKSNALLVEPIVSIPQAKHLSNPTFRITFEEVSAKAALRRYATGLVGRNEGDSPRFIRYFWEISQKTSDWEFFQTTTPSTCAYGGRTQIVLWEKEKGSMYRLAESVKHLNHAAQKWLSGKPHWGKSGVAINLMGELQATIYSGDRYDTNCCTIVPKNTKVYEAIWAFCSSPNLNSEVRKLDKKVNVTVGSVLDASFDLEHWQKVADERYPDGLPEPYSDDPTQWLFNGAITQTTDSLQVAVARLLGYAWPEQGKSTDAHPFPASENDLSSFIDEDGIMPLHAAVGQRSDCVPF